MTPEHPEPSNPVAQSVPATPIAPTAANNSSPVTPAANLKPTGTPAPPKKHKHKFIKWVVLVVVLMALSSTGSYFFGKHNQKIVYRAPIPPPISLPRQTVLVANCVPGLGKEYVIPKDIPTGPIYYTQNRKVIAVEYDYKAVQIYLNPDLLSNAILPLTKNYQINSFEAKIASLNASSPEDAQNDMIKLTMYVVPKSEAQKITCTGSQTN